MQLAVSPYLKPPVTKARSTSQGGGAGKHGGLQDGSSSPSVLTNNSPGPAFFTAALAGN